ncbi:eukaryotic translation initiation factor 4 gamma 1-like isoform X1, partial [Clarias magur]
GAVVQWLYRRVPFLGHPCHLLSSSSLVIMKSAHQHQAPAQRQQALPRQKERPCQQFRKRGHNKGRHQITEEIMASGKARSTAALPQSGDATASGSVQVKGKIMTPAAAVPVTTVPVMMNPAHQQQAPPSEKHDSPQQHKSPHKQSVTMKLEAKPEQVPEPEAGDIQDINTKSSAPEKEETTDHRVKEELALAEGTTVLSMPMQKIDLNSKVAKQMLDACKEFLSLSCPSGYAPASGSEQTKGKLRTPAAAFPVSTVPVMMNPAYQQQAPPPEQQAPPRPDRTPRKQIIIRDPSAGGRDITEEIMSGRMTRSTPPHIRIQDHCVGGGRDITEEIMSERKPTSTSTPHDVVLKVSCSVQTQGESLTPPAAVPVQPSYALTGTAANKETGFHVATPTPEAVSELECIPVPNSDAGLEPITEPVVAEVQEISAKTSAPTEEENENEVGRVEEKPAPAQGTTMQPVLSVPKKKIGMNSKVARQVLDACKEIRIRDPCVGVRDITEEIMSGRMTASTHTPPDATPTPASTAKAVSEHGCIPVARDLLQEPSEQDVNVDAELGLITEPVVAEVQEISVKTSATEEENEIGRVEEEPPATEETTMQDVLSEPKKKSDQINKVLGDVSHAYEELNEVLPSCDSVSSPSLEEMEEKEDKPDPANTEPATVKSVENKSEYEYEEEHSKAVRPKERKKYDREFLLSLRFTTASMCEPENFHIIDAILNEPPQLCKFHQGQQKKPRRIITGVCLSNNVQLNKAEEAWTPVLRKSCSSNGDPEMVKTQELFRKMRGILNKMTPQMFGKLMKQVTELDIDTEDRLKGVVDLIFEKAITEPLASVTYANMCHCLMRLKVPTLDKPGASVNFHRLLLIRCQEEFEKDRDNDKFKQKELDAPTKKEVCLQLKEELEEEKARVHHRSLGNIKFIGELFKLKMLTEPIMHYCITELLKNQTENSLECLCKLLTTIGKDLDFEKTKPCMDRYFRQMEKIMQERKASSRICFMLQDVLDLRRNNWVPQRSDQDPKTINQIHEEAELEEKREQIKVQQQHLCKKAWSQEKVCLLSKPQDKSSAFDTSHLKFQSQQGQHKRPHRFITSLCLSNDVQLNKADEAWTPVVRKSLSSSNGDPEMVKTQELFRKMRSILNKMTPQMFNKLMKQVTKLTIDTEDRLKGVVNLIFEKAIAEPMASGTYANMCHCLMRLKVPTSDKPGASVNFHSVLLNRCQEEFEKVRDNDKIFKQEKLDAATEMKDKMEEEKTRVHHRSLGNIKFIGELFKLKMLTEPIMQYCITKLLKNQTEDSLECLCKLLTTIGKDLDFEKTKPCMDQYFHQMENILQERKVSSRIRFILQNVLDLRRNNWVTQQVDQDPKTINQIHKEAELEEKREQIKVQRQLLCKKAWSQEKGCPLSKPQDKSSAFDTSHLKPSTLDLKNLLFDPGGRRSSGCCGKGNTGTSEVNTSTEQAKCETMQVSPPAPSKLLLSKHELGMKSTTIIEEYLEINNLQETAECVQQLNSVSLLFVFVREAVDLTLEHSTIARQQIGLLLDKLISASILPPEQYYKGLKEILEAASDMAVDIPEIWLHLAEIITPVLHDGGIPMGVLFRVPKKLVPCGKILDWKDFLPKEEDIKEFVRKQ